MFTVTENDCYDCMTCSLHSRVGPDGQKLAIRQLKLQSGVRRKKVDLARILE